MFLSLAYFNIFRNITHVIVVYMCTVWCRRNKQGLDWMNPLWYHNAEVLVTRQHTRVKDITVLTGRGLSYLYHCTEWMRTILPVSLYWLDADYPTGITVLTGRGLSYLYNCTDWTRTILTVSLYWLDADNPTCKTRWNMFRTISP